MSSYLLASKFSFLANPLNTLFNSHSHAVGSLEEQVKLRSVRLSRSHVFPFLARCCDRILFCLSAFLFIMQSRQTLWFLTSQLCPSDLIYKHRLWQLRAAQGQTSSLTNTQVVILYLLFLINLQSNPLFSPRAGQRSGSLRHPRSFSGKRLKYLLTQELKLKRSAMLFFLWVFTCSDFTFPWMLSWDAPRASLASDESETKTESCDKALLPRLIFDL